MAVSTSYLTTLLSRVSSIQLGSHDRRTSYLPLHVGPTIPSFVPLSSSPPRSSVIAFWRPIKKKESHLATKGRPQKKKTALDDFMDEEEQEYIEEEEEETSDEEEEEEEEEEEYSGEDALEAFFSQLEKDINNHDPSQEDVEIKEEDVARFEKELAQSLGEGELEEGDMDGEGIEEEDDLIRLPQLKTWQMRKLARALKIGRRKAGIKKLSEDVGLERATVLEFLRNPPPSLLLMSDSLPDEPSPQPSSELENRETISSISSDASDVKSKVAEPEVKQQVRPVQLPPQKRLKRVQIETLERVYSRTKRPSNEMISSIVHVTNLPRKIVIKWFEEKREQDGVPHQPLSHSRYERRSVAQTVSR